MALHSGHAPAPKVVLEQLPNRGFLRVDSSVVVEYEPTIEGVHVRKERCCNNKQRIIVNLQGVELKFKVHLVHLTSSSRQNKQYSVLATSIVL